MPIEENITKAIKRFIFNKKLPKFIDMAKYLERRLKEGENLLVGVGEHEIKYHSDVDFIYLELHNTEGKSERVVTLNCLGDITYEVDIFKDYRPLLESQRKR